MSGQSGGRDGMETIDHRQLVAGADLAMIGENHDNFSTHIFKVLYVPQVAEVYDTVYLELDDYHFDSISEATTSPVPEKLRAISTGNAFSIFEGLAYTAHVSAGTRLVPFEWEDSYDEQHRISTDASRRKRCGERGFLRPTRA